MGQRRTAPRKGAFAASAKASSVSAVGKPPALRAARQKGAPHQTSSTALYAIKPNAPYSRSFGGRIEPPETTTRARAAAVGRARGAWKLARDQWLALDRPDEAAEVEALLR